MENEKICFIRPRLKNDYYHHAIKKMKYEIYIPYRDYNLIFRLLREIWFRVDILPKKIWYNKKILKSNAEVFIVKDPLMTVDFLRWLRKNKPKARIILSYSNRVKSSFDVTLVTNEVDEKWSYDIDDVILYSMKYRPPMYFDCYRLTEVDLSEYDVVYVGRDKGRKEQVSKLQKELELKGLRVCFYICASRSYQRIWKREYKPVLKYEEYLKLIGKSKAILNIMPEGQKSITMREMEAIFNGIKCITNMKAIREFKLYHPSRFFVLGVDDMDKLQDFLNSRFEPIEELQLEEYKFENVVSSMLIK